MKLVFELNSKINLLCFIGEIGLSWIIQAIQFAVENFEAEKAHFWIGHLLDTTTTIHTNTVMIGCMTIGQMVCMSIR